MVSRLAYSCTMYMHAHKVHIPNCMFICGYLNSCTTMGLDAHTSYQYLPLSLSSPQKGKDDQVLPTQNTLLPDSPWLPSALCFEMHKREWHVCHWKLSLSLTLSLGCLQAQTLCPKLFFHCCPTPAPPYTHKQTPLSIAARFGKEAFNRLTLLRT